MALIDETHGCVARETYRCERLGQQAQTIVRRCELR